MKAGPCLYINNKVSFPFKKIKNLFSPPVSSFLFLYFFGDSTQTTETRLLVELLLANSPSVITDSLPHHSPLPQQPALCLILLLLLCSLNVKRFFNT